MRWILMILLAVSIGILSGCSGNPPPADVVEQKDVESQVFVGLASYYGPEFAGKTTASGEAYDPSIMTAAHKTLPFGTRVRVTNLENNRTVLVTVTDRGPSKPDRIIDVSFNAAQELMMVSTGVVKVRVEVVHEE